VNVKIELAGLGEKGGEGKNLKVLLWRMGLSARPIDTGAVRESVGLAIFQRLIK